MDEIIVMAILFRTFCFRFTPKKKLLVNVMLISYFSNIFVYVFYSEAVKALLKAIEIYTDMGRFTMAAKQHQSIAEMYETEFVDFDKAIYHYQQAADYFRGEESNASANKCLLKVAQYSAQLENYQKAIEIYEEVNILPLA